MTMQTATAIKPASTDSPVDKKINWWRLLAELAICTVLAVLFLEWFLGACGIGQQEFLQPDPILGVRHIPGKLVTWRLEGFSHDHFSSSGLRDVEHQPAKQPGVTRIAVLGDSSTEGMQVALDETYTRVLQKELNASTSNKYEVINFACSSYSTGQQLLQLKSQVAAYHPDVVVLLYNRGDSIENTRNPVKPGAEPRPYFYIDGQGKLQVDYAVMKEQPAPNAVQSFLQRNSHIYGVFSQANLALSLHEVLYRRLRSLFLNLSAGLSGKPVHPATAQALYPTPDAWQVTKALLLEMNNECKRNGCRFILMMFPNTLGDPEFKAQAEKFKEISRQEGFAYIDLTGPFMSNPQPNALFLQYHFSAAGHKVAADTLYKEITGSD